jgi:hypothetical protein
VGEEHAPASSTAAAARAAHARRRVTAGEANTVMPASSEFERTTDH